MSITKIEIEAWKDSKNRLKEAKEIELEIRKGLCGKILKAKAKGTVHYKKFGYDLAATAKINKKIDSNSLKKLFKDLSNEEKKCIRYKPELKMQEYQDLSNDSILHKAVIITPGTPELKIKEIKEV
jgi:hypothetical protein